MPPLKAHPWLNLAQDREAGAAVDAQDIKKHSSDVFRLAATLPGEPGPEFPTSILSDLSRFLDVFPPSSPEWPAILSAVEATPWLRIPSSRSLTSLQTCYRLPSS